MTERERERERELRPPRAFVYLHIFMFLSMIFETGVGMGVVGCSSVFESACLRILDVSIKGPRSRSVRNPLHQPNLTCMSTTMISYKAACLPFTAIHFLF